MQTNCSLFPLSQPLAKSHKPGKKQLFAHYSILGFLSEHYGWILLGLGIGSILLGNIEHLPAVHNLLLFHYIETGLIFLLLAVTGFLTRTLLSALSERSQAVATLELKNELDVYLSGSQDVQELTRRLVRRIALIIPAIGIELYLYDRQKSWFYRTADLTEEALNGQSQNPPGIDPISCTQLLANHPNKIVALNACRQGNPSWQLKGKNSYCLPLVQDSQPVGLLFLHLPLHQDLTAEQLDLMDNISGDISILLYMALEKKSRDEEMLVQKINNIHLEIARDLHDTVGQNISFLRMKLDFLTEADLKNRNSLDVDIQQMLMAANESYDLLRGTLAILQSGKTPAMLQLFTQHAELVAERAMFQLDFSSQGEPRALSSPIFRQLFYVFREALSNIEKYARANHVSVVLSWEKEHLKINIVDNGCGFDPAQVLKNGHYGLRFIRERIMQINGEVTIQSEVGLGTKINLQVPYIDD